MLELKSDLIGAPHGISSIPPYQVVNGSVKLLFIILKIFTINNQAINGVLKVLS